MGGRRGSHRGCEEMDAMDGLAGRVVVRAAGGPFVRAGPESGGVVGLERAAGNRVDA